MYLVCLIAASLAVSTSSLRQQQQQLPRFRKGVLVEGDTTKGDDFAGIHGWIDEVMNDKEELQFLSLFWNCRGKKFLDPKRCCHIRPCVPEDAEGVVKGGQIIGVDHHNRRFGMEHLGDADFETEETRVRQHKTSPRKSISHPGGARAGRSRAGGLSREIPRKRSTAG